MAVYVDSGRVKLGRMVMCHMMADSTSELLAFADSLGLQRKWLQNSGSHREHFDVSKAKRKLAVELGAVELSSRELVKMMRKKLTAGQRVRLSPFEDEPEQFGQVLKSPAHGVVPVLLEAAYREEDDDGFREVPVEQVEVV